MTRPGETTIEVDSVHGKFKAAIESGVTTARELATNVGSRMAVAGHDGRGHIHTWDDRYRSKTMAQRVVGRRLEDDEVVLDTIDYVYVEPMPVDA